VGYKAATDDPHRHLAMLEPIFGSEIILSASCLSRVTGRGTKGYRAGCGQPVMSSSSRDHRSHLSCNYFDGYREKEDSWWEGWGDSGGPILLSYLIGGDDTLEYCTVPTLCHYRENTPSSILSTNSSPLDGEPNERDERDTVMMN
jgi:hypothetical protein